MKKQMIFWTLSLGFLFLLITPVAHTESAHVLKENEESVREQMLRITKELGTTCTECHNVNDFKSDAKPNFKIAAKHLKIVAALQANGFDGKGGPQANCYMCHRAQLKPPAKAPNEK